MLAGIAVHALAQTVLMCLKLTADPERELAFAFLTNKPFVFKSHDWSMKTVGPELTKFVACRIGSGVMEVAIIWLTVDILCWNGNWMKIVVSVLVIILNYIGSKLLVFKNQTR